MEAASTFQILGEATAVTQQVIDAKTANPMAGDRLIISVSRPITRSGRVHGDNELSNAFGLACTGLNDMTMLQGCRNFANSTLRTLM